ncbi:glycosyltransferase family 2 protein [Thermodesulfobacteriota bacterium]
MPNGGKWPKISIVTPSYNHGPFIEETIRSVLLQNYPNIEYIITDGCSTDNSVSIIKKYEPWLSYWSSEKDIGQANAINKGFQKSSGNILAWLNSDDMLAPNCLMKAIPFLSQKSVGAVYGNRGIIDAKSNLKKIVKGMPFFRWQFKFRCGIPQETVFLEKKYFTRVGGLDEKLHFALDYDLWLRISRLTDFYYIPEVLGYWREHKLSKSVLVKNRHLTNKNVENMMKEFDYVQNKNLGRISSYIEKSIYMFIYELLRSAYNKKQLKKAFHFLYELSPKPFR